MEFKRNIQVYKNHFWEFYNKQTEQVQRKIDHGIGLIRGLEQVPKKFFDKMTGTDGLWEIRIKVGSNIFRIFCFFDKRNLVILLHGFQKKTQKIPKRQIQKAEQLKKEYYENKSRK